MSINKLKSKPIFTLGRFSLAFLAASLFLSCSFDYGAGQGAEGNKPDIIMENIEYARVRGGDLLARFHAEHAERWEERQTMGLREFSFEQMEDQGKTVNVEGTAGAAEVQLESGDISLSGGVIINIESEDITINAPGIAWKDNEKTITGGRDEEVEVQRSDGTNFIGRGFFADVRSRTFTFSGEVWGSFVEEDEEDGDTIGVEYGADSFVEGNNEE